MKKQNLGTGKTIGIYSIISPVGKIYIGQSTDVCRRWKQYKNQHFKKQYKLYYSIKKYGYENHTFNLVEECKEQHLNERERFWQEHYNVLEKGLNLALTETTEKRKKHSEETKIKIREAQKGKILTKEHKKKLSEARKKLPDIVKKANGYANKGRVVPEDVRTKISNKLQGITRSTETKKKMRKPKSESHRLNISLAHKGKPSLIKGIPDEIITCPHCQKSGGNSGMKRWHFDKCIKKVA